VAGPPERALGRYRGVGAQALAALAIFLAGCGFDHPPRVRLDPQVQRPGASVVLITVDGMSVPVMDELLADAALPNVCWMIDNGVRVQQAVSGCPTVTYSQLTSLLTGRFPGHHGILGNHWFDRYSLTYRDYATTETYRWVDGDFRDPTLYERLRDRMTVSIQCAVRRGATRVVDNWASTGIRWFFQMYDCVDQLMPTRFELVAELANQTGRWPELVHAYFPSTDEVGHRWGRASPQYRAALRNVDRQIGRIRSAVESAGMTDRTFFVLVSDHGHVLVPKQNYFDIAGWLRRARGLAVTETVYRHHAYEARHRFYSTRDAVVVVDGDRMGMVHLRGPHGWHERPTRLQLARLIEPTAGLRPIWQHDGVLLAACRGVPEEGETAVELYSRWGHSRISARYVGGPRLYRYDVLSGDALGDWADAGLSASIAAGEHDGSQWFEATAGSLYPDFIVQLVALFDSPRAGDVVLFAADGWDFRPGNRGGHGSILAADLRIPMIFVGPGIAKGRTIPRARLVDVAPTVLHLIRGHGLLDHEPPMDGVDLTSQLFGRRE
jgi:arylsulfatase A-like enzyme